MHDYCVLMLLAGTVLCYPTTSIRERPKQDCLEASWIARLAIVLKGAGLLGQIRGGIVLGKADSQLGLHPRSGDLQHPSGRVHALLNARHPLHSLPVPNICQLVDSACC